MIAWVSFIEGAWIHLQNCSLPFWKDVYSKRKEFAPQGSKFFPFRVDSFSKGVQESKQEITKIVFLGRNCKKKKKKKKKNQICPVLLK